MTASAVGFVTRAQAGLVKPRSVSYNVDPERGGTAFHHGGDGGPPSTHAGCIARWKSWQSFHMNDRGWVDIAYSQGVCDHGYVFAGRGYGVRTAAMGTNDGNQRFMAVVWIGGGSAKPTQLALDAFEWCVLENRNRGAGNEVRPHSYFHSTSCPGDTLRSHAASLHNKSINVISGSPLPTTGEGDDDMDPQQSMQLNAVYLAVFGPANAKPTAVPEISWQNPGGVKTSKYGVLDIINDLGTKVVALETKIGTGTTPPATGGGFTEAQLQAACDRAAETAVRKVLDELGNRT